MKQVGAGLACQLLRIIVQLVLLYETSETRGKEESGEVEGLAKEMTA